MDSSGTGAARLLNEDGSWNSPAAPAPRGSIVTLWATGYGQIVPAGIDGRQPWSPLIPRPRLPVSVAIGGVVVRPEEICFMGVLEAGVLQIKVRVPASVWAGGAVEVLLTVGSSSSQRGATMSVS